MKSRPTTIFLFISGLMLLGIGLGILFVPHGFHASNGIVLSNDPNLLSEIRAPGGLLIGSGVLILLGAFRSTGRSLAILLTILVYGTFALARLIGMIIDGMPSEGIVVATAIELAVAALGLLVSYKRAPSQHANSSSELAVTAN